MRRDGRDVIEFLCGGKKVVGDNLFNLIMGMDNYFIFDRLF